MLSFPIFSRKSLLLFLSVILIGAMIIWVSRTSSEPVVTQVMPPTKAVGISLFQKISYQFDKPFKLSDVTVTSVPDEKWELIQPEPNVLTLKHELAFHPSTPYLVTLNLANKELHKLEFTTEKTQGDVRLTQEIKAEVSRDYPLAKETPFKHKDYRIVYVAPLTLEITLLSKTLNENSALTILKSWITTNGGDPAIHKLQVTPFLP